MRSGLILRLIFTDQQTLRPTDLCALPSKPLNNLSQFSTLTLPSLHVQEIDQWSR